jgi:hypothetical protein
MLTLSTIGKYLEQGLAVLAYEANAIPLNGIMSVSSTPVRWL